MLIGITRVRNEALIIKDTIRHFLNHCDGIILYDDFSEDGTADLAQSAGGDSILVIRGTEWHSDRMLEETRHRNLLLNHARDCGANWVLCFDADERLVGELPGIDDAVGYRLRLFDGYMTEQRRQEYSTGKLAELQRMWGPEYRDILMLFHVDHAEYYGLDRREPITKGKVLLAPTMVKHFGKCLSVKHWTETCRYYADHFPEPYRSKWNARFGKAIHQKSDFDRPLFTWRELMNAKSQWVGI